MNFIKTSIQGLIIIEPQVFEDDRGYFYESYNKEKFDAGIGYPIDFVQDNQSKSSKGVLRGLHYQCGVHAQAKLVRVLSGEVLDVAVDLRPNSKTHGKWESILLTGKNKKQLFVPRGFAHGFIVLSDTAEFAYKCDNLYNKESEGGIIYNDPKLNIDWGMDISNVLVSDKDKELPIFGEHKPAF
jgi:dTDP-4-dehydrorhamnose 3,5-epimerase